jgi:hypothetical protein
MRVGPGTRRICLPLSCVFLLAPAVANAQSPGAQTAKSFVRNLFFQDIVDSQESPALVNQIASDSADRIAGFVGLAISTVPVTSSSAGFTYVRDRTTGELSLKTESFGPSFAERPITGGKGVWNLGVNYQRSHTTFDGAFGTADGKSTGLPIFDNTATYTSDGFVQFITKRAFLDTTSNTVNFLASYGLTDRLDVAVSVPVVSLTVAGRTEEAYDVSRQWNAGEISLTDRPTPAGTKVIAQSSSISTSGIGDVAIRLKYSLIEAGGDGVAVAADVTAPTGNADQLLGAGKASVKVLLLASKAGLGPASIHANAGYTAGGLSDEVNYVVGTDAALLPKKQLTASISFLGRTLRNAALPERVQTVQRTVNNGSTGPRDIAVYRFIWSPTALTLLQVAAGAKLSIGGNWLLDASVLVAVNERGYQARITPVVGLERTLGP